DLASGMGVLGLSLAGVGLFGLLSFNVARRSREFGIRLALGARGHDLMGQVMGDASRLLGVGISAGLLLAYPIARLAESRLVGISANDPWSYAIAVALL